MYSYEGNLIIVNLNRNSQLRFTFYGLIGSHLNSFDPCSCVGFAYIGVVPFDLLKLIGGALVKDIEDMFQRGYIQQNYLLTVLLQFKGTIW